MIAGLEATTAGKITIGARDVTRLDPADRGVAMVFQTYALYPHMTVAENMGFGLRMNRVAKPEIARKVAEAAAILRLEPYLERKPKALSGGQRQRVAIGRAIVRGPEVFLFDEPLSNLDAELRVEMRVEIARLHDEIGATMIYVTHDQIEAMTLADKIVVLRDGRIEQIGAPLTLYDDPDNAFVAGFIGSPRMNFLEGLAERGGVRLPGLGGMVVPSNVVLPTGPVSLGVRPEHLGFADGDTVRIDLIEHLGGVSHVHVVTGDGQRLVAEARDMRGGRAGTTTGLVIDPAHVAFFDPATGRRLR
jgi:lactose/L-arabinose transport system ATP-binding protein